MFAAAAVAIKFDEDPEKTTEVTKPTTGLAQGIAWPPAWHDVQAAGTWPLGKVDSGENDEDVIVHPSDYVQTMAEVESMNEESLLVGLRNTLSSALASEARGDADAAVAKTAAIKNIQKALTARILKRLDDGQPLVEVARKMKAIEGMQPQINDMERRLGIMQSVEPVLENAIKTLQKVVDVRGMGKK